MADAALIAAEGALGPLYAALARAIGRAQPVGKDAQNEHHRYRYASAEALIEEARAPLAAEGLCVIQSWSYAMREVVAGKSQEHFADVTVTYRVGHADGGALTFAAETPAIRDRGRPEDKAIATALTYSLGYFLRALLLLPRVDEEHEVDRRDDRAYEPPAQRSNGNGARDQRQAAPQSQQGKQRPAFDLEGELASIGTTKTEADLRALAPLLADAPDAAKGPLRAAYKTQMDKLRAAAPAPAQTQSKTEAA